MTTTAVLTDASRLGLSLTDARAISGNKTRLDQLAHGLIVEYQREYTPGGGSSRGGFTWDKVEPLVQERWLRSLRAGVDLLTRERPLHHKDRRNSKPGLNINDAEAIVADEQRLQELAFTMGYAFHYRSKPGWRDSWGVAHQEYQLRWLRVAAELVRDLVVDSTTAGCRCDYCTLAPDKRHGHAKPLMCSQRWHSLPLELRQDIAESCQEY